MINEKSILDKLSPNRQQESTLPRRPLHEGELQVPKHLSDHAFMLKANLLIKPDVIKDPEPTVRHKIAPKDIMAFISGQGGRLITLFEGR